MPRGFKVDGKKPTEKLFYLEIIDDYNSEIVVKSEIIADLKNIVQIRNDFIKNKNVQDYGFTEQSTEVIETQNGMYQVCANIQKTIFKSVVTDLNHAVFIRDYLIVINSDYKVEELKVKLQKLENRVRELKGE